MPPVNVFNGSLIRDTFRKSQGSLRGLRVALRSGEMRVMCALRSKHAAAQTMRMTSARGLTDGELRRDFFCIGGFDLEPPLLTDTSRGVNAFYSAFGILTR